MDFSIKVHESQGEVIVACCDLELLGKTLTDEEIEIEIGKHFYEGSICRKAELVKALENASSANIIGDKAVDVAIATGFVEEDSVIEICGIKHAQIYRL